MNPCSVGLIFGPTAKKSVCTLGQHVNCILVCGTTRGLITTCIHTCACTCTYIDYLVISEGLGD